MPHRVSRRLIKQKARGQAPPPVKVADRPSTACKHTVSGTVSLPSPGFFSPFPHGTRSLSVASECLALEDGPPRFPRDCTCPAVLGNCLQEDRTRFVYRTITFSGWPFQAPSTAYRFCDFRVTPETAPQPRPYRYGRFGLFRVRSPLLTESLLLSFPLGTEMFQFPRFAPDSYGFTAG